MARSRSFSPAGRAAVEEKSRWLIAERAATKVVDASVVAKWFLEEPGKETARQLRQEFIDRRVQLVVPDLFFFEVGQILKRHQMVVKSDVTPVYQSVLAMLWTVTPQSTELLMLTMGEALRYHISFYDASYLAAAAAYDCQVITADEACCRRVGNPARMILLDDWGRSYR